MAALLDPANVIVQFVREQCNMPTLADAIVEHGTSVGTLAKAAEDGPSMVVEYCNRELGVKMAFGTARKLASKLYEISTTHDSAAPALPAAASFSRRDDDDDDDDGAAGGYHVAGDHSVILSFAGVGLSLIHI